MGTIHFWLMDKDSYGYEHFEIEKSNLFMNVICDILLQKYLPNRRIIVDGKSLNYWGSSNKDELLPTDLNECITISNDFSDRICWELYNQSFFHSKDKNIIANAIGDFLSKNISYKAIQDINMSAIDLYDIITTFRKVISIIRDIDEDEYPYFQLSTECITDITQHWFRKINKETGKEEGQKLSDIDVFVCDFIFINNGHITYKSNVDMFKEDN